MLTWTENLETKLLPLLLYQSLIWVVRKSKRWDYSSLSLCNWNCAPGMFCQQEKPCNASVQS